jgi:micrococcal nuclease
MLTVVRRWVVLAMVLAVGACSPIDGTTTGAGNDRGPGVTAEATVTRVVDGDTVHVFLDGKDVTIRLIGIDTPETVAPGQPVECFGPEASRFAIARLTGRDVLLEFDRDPIDPFGRTLAYLWLGGQLFNETLVAQGFAQAKSHPPNTAHQAALDAAEDLARRANRGRWGAC